jgi:hypothetical protein
MIAERKFQENNLQKFFQDNTYSATSKGGGINASQETQSREKDSEAQDHKAQGHPKGPKAKGR